MPRPNALNPAVSATTADQLHGILDVPHGVQVWKPWPGQNLFVALASEPMGTDRSLPRRGGQRRDRDAHARVDSEIPHPSDQALEESAWTGSWTELAALVFSECLAS
jgi:hypothetical protein